MKPIKLIITFVLILGGIVAAFHIILKPDPTPIIVFDGTALQEYRKQFEDDWKNRKPLLKVKFIKTVLPNC